MRVPPGAIVMHPDFRRTRGFIEAEPCRTTCYTCGSSILSGRVAQLVEHTTENRSVDSSILSPATTLLSKFAGIYPTTARRAFSLRPPGHSTCPLALAEPRPRARVGARYVGTAARASWSSTLPLVAASKPAFGLMARLTEAPPHCQSYPYTQQQHGSRLRHLDERRGINRRAGPLHRVDARAIAERECKPVDER
jgi:hypothetical protein